jgi:hypothetical protein
MGVAFFLVAPVAGTPDPGGRVISLSTANYTSTTVGTGSR